MKPKHREAHRAAREAFVTAHSDQLRDLAELQTRIATKLVERRNYKARNGDNAGILAMMEDEAMRELALLIQAPRRPDGLDQPTVGDAKEVIPYDLPPDEARAFIAANEWNIRPHSMDLVDVVRAERQRRPLAINGRKTGAEKVRMSSLTRTVNKMRARMPDWEEVLNEWRRHVRETGNKAKMGLEASDPAPAWSMSGQEEEASIDA